MREGSYLDGKKHGSWTLYHPNGSKKSEATFVEGKYVGLYTSYHPNGNRRWQGRYNEITGTSADGTKDGVWLDYAEDGETIKRRMTYKRGSKVKPEEYAPFEDEAAVDNMVGRGKIYGLPCSFWQKRMRGLCRLYAAATSWDALPAASAALCFGASRTAIRSVQRSRLGFGCLGASPINFGRTILNITILNISSERRGKELDRDARSMLEE